jgi:hypothetical protein
MHRQNHDPLQEICENRIQRKQKFMLMKRPYTDEAMHDLNVHVTCTYQYITVYEKEKK